MVARTVTLPADLVARAEAANLDLSGLAEKALRDALLPAERSGKGLRGLGPPEPYGIPPEVSARALAEVRGEIRDDTADSVAVNGRFETGTNLRTRRII